MPEFEANENYEIHLINMDYTNIQNAKAKAIDEEDWDTLTQLQNAENKMFTGL